MNISLAPGLALPKLHSVFSFVLVCIFFFWRVFTILGFMDPAFR